jgi:hypothetical protein
MRLGLWTRKGSAEDLPVDGGLGAEVWREGLPARRRTWGIGVGRGGGPPGLLLTQGTRAAPRTSWSAVDARHHGSAKEEGDGTRMTRFRIGREEWLRGLDFFLS